MNSKRHQTRPRTDFSYVSTDSLVSSIAETGSRPNVRLMEALLARGRDMEPGFANVLHYAVSHYESGDDRPNPVWLAVVAGERRLQTAVAPLLRLLRAAPRHDDVALLAAAEALAKIGATAVEGVAEVARDGEWWQRIWAFASLGWNTDVRAGEILDTALAEEVSLPDGVSLADAVVKAIVDRGDPGFTPALMEAIRACDPDLRGDIEDAIRDIHNGQRDRLIDWDWRLRYQMDPDHGFIDCGWPANLLGFTEDDGRRPRLKGHVPADRTLAEILAQRRPIFGVRVDPDGNPLCRCCDAPMWLYTGVWVCPATAMTVAWIQDRWLTRARDELRLDDLFDVFDLLEDEYHALYHQPDRPPTPWDQDEVGASEAVRWAWLGIEWLIEQGIDGVQDGMDRLREESMKLVGLEAVAKRTRGLAGTPSVN